MKQKSLTLLGFMVYVLGISCAYGAEYVDPTTFSGTPEEKKKVVDYIQKTAQANYRAGGLGDESTLKLVEQEDLRAFEALTRIQDKAMVRQVAKESCELEVCDYTTIYIMYQDRTRVRHLKPQW